MIFNETKLNGNFLIDIERKGDNRGFFARMFCENEFEQFGLNTNWKQANTSLSVERGSLRGLHAQTNQHAEVKLVRCIKGAIWDVVVDLRKSSSTFGEWFGAEISEVNRTMMYVPRGFAHGFISLTDDAEIIYLVSNLYSPGNEVTLAWDDKEVQIDWPIPPTVISEKDQLGLTLQKIKEHHGSGFA